MFATLNNKTVLTLVWREKVLKTQYNILPKLHLRKKDIRQISNEQINLSAAGIVRTVLIKTKYKDFWPLKKHQKRPNAKMTAYQTENKPIKYFTNGLWQTLDQVKVHLTESNLNEGQYGSFVY